MGPKVYFIISYNNHLVGGTKHFKNQNWHVTFLNKKHTLRLKTGDWPPFCYFIAWILTVLFILGGMGLVAMYGLQVENN